ncbi:MAG: threonine synthase, partial [Treponema sp.]|nr:threonine synthase [Treponema sp.]
DINRTGLTNSAPAWGKAVVDRTAVGIILETAHPAKFGSTVIDAIGREPSMPDRLERVMSLPDRSIPMKKDYDSFKEWLVSNL